MRLRSYVRLPISDSHLYELTIGSRDDHIDLSRVQIMQRDVTACCGSLSSAHDLADSFEPTPDTRTHSILSPSFNGLETSEISPVSPSGPKG